MLTRVLLLVLLAGACLGWKVREALENNPIANPKAIFTFGNARFTVLTPQIIRLEYSTTGEFVDAASLAIVNRYLPVPPITNKTYPEAIIIITDNLQLTFNKVADPTPAFTAKNLNISFFFNGGTVTWYPGLPNPGNLNGTRMSLDCYTTACQNGMPLEAGLISQSGWNVYDDSETPLFDYTTKQIPWIIPQRNSAWQDWYFFGYGFDYTQLLFDFSTLSGPIAIPPTSAFGTWWSRYYNYSQSEITDQVIEGYINYSLPLNHLVLDMDWHVEVNDKQCQTWGGWTWNTGLFPDPPSFIDYVHSLNLKLLLNVHPQTGVDVCQEEYHALASAIGFNTATNATIQCNYTDYQLAISQFDIVQDPVGVDFWWTDYSGCGDAGDYNLLWSNHVYFYEKFNKGERPLTLSRFGGIGNHRYPIGFSGDVFSVWESLQFEIYFTPTAANVLFGYWSHDTGGFHGTPPSDELYLRWLQFAAVEPIFRIHSDHEERRIWTFPSFELMKEAMLIRNAFGPYIYSQARRAYDTAISLVYPLYYDYPTAPEAYSYIYQYKFGEDLLAAPIVTPVDNTTNTTMKEVWLPPGNWTHFFTLAPFTGPAYLQLKVGLSDIPLFARAGAIIPLKTMASATTYQPELLQFAIFPGATQGSTLYYEDDGETTEYLNGQYSMTNVSFSIQDFTTKVVIGGTVGTFSGQPTSRTYQLIMKTVTNNPSSVTVNGESLLPNPSQNGQGWWQSQVLGGLVVSLPTIVNIGLDYAVVISL